MIQYLINTSERRKPALSLFDEPSKQTRSLAQHWLARCAGSAIRQRTRPRPACTHWYEVVQEVHVLANAGFISAGACVKTKA